MADLRSQFASRSIDESQIDAGLRAYMLKVYNYMGSGVMLTFAVAWGVAQSPAVASAVMSMGIILLLAAFGLVFFLSARIHKMSATAAQALLLGLFGPVWADPVDLLPGLHRWKVLPACSSLRQRRSGR